MGVLDSLLFGPHLSCYARQDTRIVTPLFETRGIPSVVILAVFSFQESAVINMTIKCESTALAGNISKVPSVERQRRKKKKRTQKIGVGTTFQDLYTLTGEILGEGSYGRVETCVNVYTGFEYAVKIIEKNPGLYNRGKVLKEIEIYHLCKGQQNIIQLIEYFEEDDRFCLVFEKISGGPLLDHIQARVCFTEAEASRVVSDLGEAIKYLHNRGIAHRDIKPDNILCVNHESPVPVKLCD